MTAVIKRARRPAHFTPPTYCAFPQECSACGMCGHNRMSHDRFMRAFPSVACLPECQLTWVVGEIHHGCVWCRSYGRLIRQRMLD